MNAIDRLISSHRDWFTKWERIDASFCSRPTTGPAPVALIPFSGTPFFETLSENQKNHLLRLFLKFNAEAQIIFEQFLLKAARVLLTQVSDLKVKTAIEQFRREEFIHARAFRRFLGYQFPNTYRDQDMVLGVSPHLKKCFAVVAGWEPLSVVIPGAKSETYSLFFSEYLKINTQDPQNPWVVINQMHSQDEVHHVPFDYDLLDTLLIQGGFLRRLKVIFGTFAMIFLVQFIILIGAWNLTGKVFPSDSTMRKVNLTFKFLIWVLRDFKPYQQTRKKLQQTYKKRSFCLSKLFSFTSW